MSHTKSDKTHHKLLQSLLRSSQTWYRFLLAPLGLLCYQNNRKGYQSSNVPSTESQLAAPQLIPWRYAFIVTGGLAVASALGIFVAAAAGALAAGASYMIGTYASMNGGYRKAMAVGAIVALAGGASLQFDSMLTIILTSLLLLALAS